MLNNIFVYIIFSSSYSKYNIILIMTGEEYFKLRRGDTITVETPFAGYRKGRVFKVEFVNNINTSVYIRDVTLPLGAQIKVPPLSFLLDNFIVGGKLPEKKNNKIIELPFAVGDKVWFIVDNEVHEGTLTECNITINKDDTQICYNVLYHNRINCSVVAKVIPSNKLFKTKKELLESL